MMEFGHPLPCPKCHELSYFPFYACKGECVCNISGEDKDKIHEKFVVERCSVKCEELRNPCYEREPQKFTDKRRFEEHLLTHHQMKERNLYQIPEDCPTTTRPRTVLGCAKMAIPVSLTKLGAKEEFRWPSTYFAVGSCKFIFSAVLDPSPPSQSLVHFWMFTNLEEDQEAQDYSYSVNLIGNTKTFSMHSWHYYDFQQIKSRKETYVVPVKDLIPFCKVNRHGVTEFYLKIEIFKNEERYYTPSSLSSSSCSPSASSTSSTFH